MAELPSPTLRLHIDKDALARNWRALDRLSGTARAGAAVKADCYGLGMDTCLPVLRDAGCRDFFVAHWSEVPAVLDHVPAEQLSVLHGVGCAAEAEYARATGVRPVIDSVRQAKIWTESGGGPCHLMVDTGINRLGISPGEASDPAIQDLSVEVLMSHLACADEDSDKNPAQLGAFREVMNKVAHRETSLANSAGVALGSEFSFDLTRPGLALYGGIPRPELADIIQQVAYPQAKVIQTRPIQAGESVGYNSTFTATSQMRIGVASLGYADGILLNWSGGHFEAGSKRLAILGKVSMDMIVLDLTDAPEIGEGNWVSLPYHLPDAARQTSLSQYELLTVLGRRFG